MSTLTVINLIMVILSGAAQPEVKTRQFDSVAECTAAAADLHKAVENSVGVVDIGTICIESKFDLSIKPRA